MPIYEDNFSVITYDESAGVLILVWTENSSDMTDQDFKIVNLAYADLAVERGVFSLLVDVQQFGHAFNDDLTAWRNETIIPKYDRAGVQRFAFLHGEGAQIPPEPYPEGDYIVQHFTSDEEALNWLLG